MIAVDNAVLEPRPQRVDGADAILRHFRYSGDQSGLGPAAVQLIRSLRGEDDRSFVAMDGEWIPSHGDSWKNDPELELKRQVSELCAEVKRLRASHQRLRDRVAALEARLEHGQPKARPSRRISEAPARIEAKPRSGLDPAVADVRAMSETQGQAPEMTQQSASAEPPREPDDAFRQMVAALQPENAPPAVRIGLPSAAQLIAAIGELQGGDPGLTPAQDAVPNSALEVAALYAGRFVDDEGNDVGVLLAEMRLVANIGGKLMGLPTTVIDEQAKTGILNEDVLLAMSEVVNALSSTINQVAGNVHVRATPVEIFPAERLHWLSSARQHVAVGRSRVGTMWLVAR